jgi:hypothetical protein
VECLISCLSTGCSNQRDAEFIHPVLGVPLCGWCHKAFKDKELFNSTITEAKEVHERMSSTPTTDPSTRDDEDSICLWCGSDDDRELYMCDSMKCTNSVCRVCVVRNFGTEEADRVKSVKTWYCYACSPTPAFNSLRVSEKELIFSLDKVFQSVDSSTETAEIESEAAKTAADLTQFEAQLASLFCAELPSTKCYGCFRFFGAIQSQFVEYLCAPDIFCGLYLVSKNIHRFFKQTTSFLPGLFQNQSSNKLAHRLHDHQVDSLRQLRHLESKFVSFGEVRGGIFADAPGLGKTVTILALICGSSGTMPRLPASLSACGGNGGNPPVKPVIDSADDNWLRDISNPVHNQHLVTILNSVRKLLNDKDAESHLKRFTQIVDSLRMSGGLDALSRDRSLSSVYTVEAFENSVRKIVNSLPGSGAKKSEIKYTFQLGKRILWSKPALVSNGHCLQT